MINAARITFIYQKQSKTAFIEEKGNPENLCDALLNFIQNRTLDEQIDFFNALFLVDPEDKPLRKLFPRFKNWRNALARREIFSVPYLFHNESRCKADFLYTIDLDKQELSCNIGWGFVETFPFKESREVIQKKLEDLETNKFWHRFLE